VGKKEGKDRTQKKGGTALTTSVVNMSEWETQINRNNEKNDCFGLNNNHQPGGN